MSVLETCSRGAGGATAWAERLSREARTEGSGRAPAVPSRAPRAHEGRSERPPHALRARRPVRTAAAIALLLAASTAAAASRPRYGGALRLALPSDALPADPAAARTPAALFLAAQLHQPPLARGPDGALRPVLLEEPPRSDDGGRTYILRLRAGLAFHDGRPLGAADLAASLRRLAEEELPCAGAIAGLPLASAEARGPREVVVRLARPLPSWPESLAELGSAVLPGGLPGSGAGPFAAAAADRLIPFAGHPDGRPFLDEVRLVAIPDARAASRALLAGKVDVGPGRVRLEPSPRFATYLFVAPALEGATAALADAIGRDALVRTFVPDDPTPLRGLSAGAPALAIAGSDAPPRRVELLLDPSVEGHLRVAERIQLRLHDAGVAVRLVEDRDPERLTRRGRYELALVRLALPRAPGLAAAAVRCAAGRRGDALDALLGGGATRGVIPLWATASPLAPAPDGAFAGFAGDSLADVRAEPAR